MVYIPSSTYRLQLSAEFTLKDVRRILPYLHQLGISTIYAAPLFKARSGSGHGYDVAEAHLVGPEIGTIEELEQLAEELKHYNMGWLQDIVPNHMVFHPENTWLMDVLEKGQKSNYASFFDINFAHPEFEGKLMVPFLGEPLEKILQQNQLQLTFTENGFHVCYSDTHYPASISLYEPILQALQGKIQDSGASEKLKNRNDHLLQVLASDKLDLPLWQQIKYNLHQTITQDQNLKKALEETLNYFNNNTQKLHELLNLQFYRLWFWQESEKRINYRRFFTVNELICLAIERPEVFGYYHRFIKQLTGQGIFQGLRVDHIDGLLDPDTYLERLRELAGNETYLVVEKILEGEENLPENWPIQGNSGYDFLAWVSNLYTDAQGQEKLTQVYKKLVPKAPADYRQLVFDKKQFVLENQMAGELDNLYRLLQEANLLAPEHNKNQYKKALSYLLCSFPVYRIYVREFPLSEQAKSVIDDAFRQAQIYGPELKEQLDHLRTIYYPGDTDTEQQKKDKLYFVMRSQQYTGPLAAKGVEDTTFYNYNRLLSLNEVGNSPEVFHIKRRDFHELMQYKLQTYRHSLNATATHDTKRGEGSRMRLQVLTELPDEWEENVTNWLRIIQKKTPAIKIAANDLYFLLQTIVGVMPADVKVEDTLTERVQEYLIKAFREAKVNTHWSEPNEEYENAVKDLVKQLLEDEQEFLPAFRPFFKKLAHYGWLYSLCQTMLKLTCPGVPDIYQGCELWDLSLVDPDNRRPVDYELRRQFLKELSEQDKSNALKLHEKLLQEPGDAQVKLYLIWKVLNERHKLKELFDFGDYNTLIYTGKYHHNLISFIRHYHGKWCLVVVPRLLAAVTKQNQLPIGEKVWEETAIKIPEGAPKKWRNVFGGTIVQGEESLKVAEIFGTFPVALLVAEDTEPFVDAELREAVEELGEQKETIMHPLHHEIEPELESIEEEKEGEEDAVV